MSLGSFIKKVLGSKPAKAVEDFALSEVQKAVAALKQTDIGDAVAADIKALASSTLTGAEKFEAVVKNTLPLVLQFVTKDGAKAVLADVESVARELVQSIFNDIKSTKAASIAQLILSLLGLR